ncbi:hypothetical protein ACQW56_33225, partial [Bacillus cereus]
LTEGELPACVTVCPTDALAFGRIDSPEIQAWIKQKSVYQYQLDNVGKPNLFRRKEIHQGDKAGQVSGEPNSIIRQITGLY